MSEWLQYRAEFLNVVLEREAPPASQTCIQCSQPMTWRCHDCLGEPVFCLRCIVASHQSLVFHRVSRWDGRSFYRSCLSDAGLVLNIGHRGQPCPAYAVTRSLHVVTNPLDSSDSTQSSLPSASDASTDTPIDVHPLPSWEATGVNLDTMKAQQSLDSDGNPFLTVVDTTGIHQIQARYCRCAESSSVPEYIQLLELGLYPASIAHPRTAFTFRVLDDYDLLNLETKATPQRYLAKLQRLTTNLFPDALPDRYRELLRVTRQWRNLKQHKNAGSAYTPSAEVLPGGLVQFCPACPQPGVNLPDDWKNDPNP